MKKILNFFFFVFLVKIGVAGAAGESAHSESQFWPFIFSVINFLLFLIILYIFAFPRVKKFFFDRSQNILQALKEAEAYPGPSIIIAYAPCINHGLREGMGKTQAQAKAAVECGYWSLFRYNPLLEAEGKNPFQLDSKEPDWNKFQDFLHSEVRFTSLIKAFPESATELFKAAEENAKWRYKSYQRLNSFDYSNIKS